VRGADQRLQGVKCGDLPAWAGLVDSEDAALEMGMTSVSTVELRSTLIERTGLELPQGIIYDMYTPTGIADFLLAVLAGAAARKGRCFTTRIHVPKFLGCLESKCRLQARGACS
jgi:hypothetical protein